MTCIDKSILRAIEYPWNMLPLEISAVTSLSPPALYIIPDVLLNNKPLRAQDESLDNEYWGMLT